MLIYLYIFCRDPFRIGKGIAVGENGAPPNPVRLSFGSLDGRALLREIIEEMLREVGLPVHEQR